MRNKLWGILLLSLALVSSCDDTTNSIGMDMVPGNDIIKPETVNFNFKTKTIDREAVYAKTSQGYVGNLDIKDFGKYSSSFITQLACYNYYEIFPQIYEEKKVADTIQYNGIRVDDEIVGARVIVRYHKWIGDSLKIQTMSLYKLQEDIKDNRYTDYKVDKTKMELLGKQSFTAYNSNLVDSLRKLSDSGKQAYYPYINFDITELGKEIWEKSKTNKEFFKDSRTFNKNVLKGLYLENELGEDLILYVDKVELQFAFNFYYTDSKGKKTQKKGKDSYVAWNTIFASTKEVIEQNIIQWKDVQTPDNNGKDTYVGSPSYFMTEIELPINEMASQLGKDSLNAVKLHLKGDYNIGQLKDIENPKDLLLVRKSEYKKFFEENRLPDQKSSFIATKADNKGCHYTFLNIARLIDLCIEEKEKGINTEDWNKVVLIPVSTTYEKQQRDVPPKLVGIKNELKPTFVKLQKPEEGDLQIIHTKFN